MNNKEKNSEADSKKDEVKKVDLSKPPTFGNVPQSRFIQFMSIDSFPKKNESFKDTSEELTIDSKEMPTSIPIFGHSLPNIEKYTKEVTEDKSDNKTGKDKE